MNERDEGNDSSRPMLHCGRFGPGHETHWIAVLNVHQDTPRTLVTLGEPKGDGWFTVSDGAASEDLWHHDAQRVDDIAPGRAMRVVGTSFLIAEDVWVYAAQHATPCGGR